MTPRQKANAVLSESDAAMREKIEKIFAAPRPNSVSIGPAGDGGCFFQLDRPSTFFRFDREGTRELIAMLEATQNQENTTEESHVTV